MKKILLLFTLILFFACSSDDNNTDDPTLLLIITIDFVSHNSAIISWEIQGNTGQVVYEIVIEGQEVADNYSNTQYEFTQLNQNTEYTGKVFAKQQNGFSTFADFSFKTGFYNFYINNQIQIDNFNHSSITGTLTIFGQDVYDLSGLSELESVGGIVINNTNITSLDGLHNLQNIGGYIYLNQNNLLEDVTAFSNVGTQIRTLEIKNCASLSDLSGMNISDDAERMTLQGSGIENLDPFTNIKNIQSIRLENLTELNSVEGLMSLETIENNLVLDNLPNLTSLIGFNNLNAFNQDFVLQGLNIENLQGLNGIITSKRISIIELNNLQSLNGFDSLELVDGGFLIQDCENLTDFGDFPYLTTVNYFFSMVNLPLLNDISGLYSLNSVEFIGFAECPSLSSLEGLNNLSTAESITLRNLNNLQNLNPLSNLNIDSYGIFDGIHLENLNSITSLEGLNNLERTYELYLNNIPNISSLNGLNGLTKVNRMIFDNLNISDLSGLDNLNNVHEITIDNCNSLQNLYGSGIIDDDEAFPSYSSKITIMDNSILSDFCGLTDYANNTPVLQVHCSDNQYNPSKSQLQSETECSQ